MMRILKRLVSGGREEKPETAVDIASTPEAKDNSIEAVGVLTRNKVLGCFLGLAIGDAKGMPAEGANPEYAKKVAETFDYVAGYLPEGHFTDDTHHSTILAESLIEKKGFDGDDFMEKLSHMDMGRGIGPTTIRSVLEYKEKKGLMTHEMVVSFLRSINIEMKDGHSPTNGPAMRIAPLAILYHYDLDLLRKYAIESSKVTHGSTESAGGALAVAFAVAYLLNHQKGPFDKLDFTKQLMDFVRPISTELAEAFKEDAQLAERHGCKVMESVPHAIRIFMQDPYDFEKAIQEAIKGGGDADTIASIVGALSGAFNGQEAIPFQWIQRLENSPKGRDYIKKIADKLYELANEQRHQ